MERMRESRDMRERKKGCLVLFCPLALFLRLMPKSKLTLWARNTATYSSLTPRERKQCTQLSLKIVGWSGSSRTRSTSGHHHHYSIHVRKSTGEETQDKHSKEKLEKGMHDKNSFIYITRTLQLIASGTVDRWARRVH